MGSKKLKAIVVGGNQEIPVFNRARLKECARKIYHSCPRKKQTDVIEDYLYVNPEDEQRLLDVLEEFGYSAQCLIAGIGPTADTVRF